MKNEKYPTATSPDLRRSACPNPPEVKKPVPSELMRMEKMCEELHRLISNIEVDLRTVLSVEPSSELKDISNTESSPMVHHILNARNESLAVACQRLASIQARLVL